jgi:hypothetical protein
VEGEFTVHAAEPAQAAKRPPGMTVAVVLVLAVVLALVSAVFRTAALPVGPAAAVPPPDVAAKAIPPPARKPARMTPAPHRRNRLLRPGADEEGSGLPAGVLS